MEGSRIPDRFRRIDVHAHIGEFHGYDLSEGTLLEEMERGRIALALVSNIDGAAVPGKTLGRSEGEANRRTAEFVDRHPVRFRGLAWGRPGSGDAGELRPFLSGRLPRNATHGWTARSFVGIKLHPEMNGFAADAASVDPYLELAAEFTVPVVVHCDGTEDEASPDRIVRLARRHPRVPVVLYHTGFGGPHEPAIEAAAGALERRDADVYLETAQLPPAAALLALERVGAGRVLFGTDATFYGSGHYDRYQPLIDTLESHLTPSGRKAVFSENALRLFRLEPDSHSR